MGAIPNNVYIAIQALHPWTPTQPGMRNTHSKLKICIEREKASVISLLFEHVSEKSTIAIVFNDDSSMHPVQDACAEPVAFNSNKNNNDNINDGKTKVELQNYVV